MLQVSPTITLDVSLSSGKTDSFERLQQLLSTKEQLERELSIKFADLLTSKANSELYSTKERYIHAISAEDNVVTLDTSDFVANMVEDGVGSFDMKPGLLNGPNVRVNKQGKKYAVVPISKYKQGRYNWRDRETGRFSKGTNIGGKVEFRIVSENSDPNSWIHPGFPGKHLFEQAIKEIDPIIDAFVDAQINTFFQ